MPAAAPPDVDETIKRLDEAAALFHAVATDYVQQVSSNRGGDDERAQ